MRGYRENEAQIARDSIFLIQISCGNFFFRLLAKQTRNYLPNVNRYERRSIIVVSRIQQWASFKGVCQPCCDLKLRDDGCVNINEKINNEVSFFSTLFSRYYFILFIILWIYAIDLLIYCNVVSNFLIIKVIDNCSYLVDCIEFN